MDINKNCIYTIVNNNACNKYVYKLMKNVVTNLKLFVSIIK